MLGEITHMKTKSNLIVLFSIFLLVLAFASFAIDYSGGKSIDTILSQIKADQSVTSDSDINPALVSDSLLAQLGEAIINQGVPDRIIHHEMHLVMGGEDPNGLIGAHIFLGYDYLSSRFYWQKDYGQTAVAGSGWAMHLTRDEFLARR
jgi:hypothetical protein